MKKKLLKILRISAYVLLGIFVLFSILPYLFPVNNKTADPKNPPFKESRFVKIDNRLWHYRVFEPKDSFLGTMLMIHGFSGSTFSWRKQEVFSDSGYRVISVDLPAFGYSEKNNNAFDHSAEAHAANIWKILVSLAVAKDKTIIFGHSMGASVAWAMAGQKPDKTEAVFLVDGAGKTGKTQKGSIGANIMKFILKYPPFLRWVDVIAGSFYFKQEKFEELLTSAYGQQADSAAAAGYMQPFLLKNSGRAVFEGFLYNRSNPEPDYGKIDCPVYLIWGSNDNWVPVAAAEKFLQKFPDSELYKIDGAGHCPMETHEGDFNRYVMKMLKKEDPINGEKILSE